LWLADVRLTFCCRPIGQLEKKGIAALLLASYHEKKGKKKKMGNHGEAIENRGSWRLHVKYYSSPIENIIFADL
jgi:hypothetical protein